MRPYDGGPIWAIDPATKTGLAEGVPGETPALSVHNFRHDKSEGSDEVFERATFFLADRLRLARPGLIAIEAPVPPRQVEGFTNFDTTLISIGLQGIFIGIARCKGIPILHAHIASWRKLFLGSGRISGPDAKRRAMALCKQLGWIAPDDNAADAAGIWSFACAQVAPALAPRIEPLFARVARVPA